MKKIFLLLIILSTFSFADAQSQTWYQSIFDRVVSFINEARKDNLSNEARLQQYENAKQLIQTEIDRLKNTVSNTVNVSTQTINSFIDFSDKSNAILSASGYYSHSQIVGKAPLTIKFVNNFASLNYGDGTNSQDLREGNYDSQMGYSLYGQTTTHTYTKPGRYVVEAFGNIPSGKRAEVEVVVQDNSLTNSNNFVNTGSTCQKISQTLWEGKELELGVKQNVVTLQKFLSNWEKTAPGYGGDIRCPDSEGVYGACTTSRIKFFQRMNGIKQTGAVGPITLAKINSMICGNQTSVNVSQNYSFASSGTYYDDFNYDGLQDKLVITGVGSGKIYVQTTSGNYVLSDELNKILYIGERGYFNLNYSNQTIETGGSLGGGMYSKKVYKIIPGIGLQLISDTATTN